MTSRSTVSLAADVPFPVLAMRLLQEFEQRRGYQLGPHLRAQLIDSIDYTLVHSKAPVEYIQALIKEAKHDYDAASLILAAASYGYQRKVAPEYIAAVFLLPFESEGHDADSRIENRVASFHEAGVPAEYAVALRGTGFTVSEVVRCWRDGLSAEYAAAAATA